MVDDAYRERLQQLGLAAEQLTLDSNGTLAVERTSVGPDAALPPLAIAEDGEPGDADLVRGDRLGLGGMGVVTSATQSSLRRPVAIKEPRSPERAGQLLREAMITGALEHPNIVPVHMLGRGPDGRPVLVMKRIDGTRWSELLQTLFSPIRPPTPDALERHLEILLQVCNAIDFAHSRGVIHRDLKPDNVMVGEFGEVYVVDWGIAHVLDGALVDLPKGESDAKLAGTPGYMAPEMAAGDLDKITPRTDVYLLGAILHELVTGQQRHVGDNIFLTLAAAYESAPYDYPPWVPDELAALCSAATKADPASRIADVAEYRTRIRDYLGHRASLELADRAQQRLDALVDLLGEDIRGQTFDAVEIHTLASEARFGLEQALAQWNDNGQARRGLQQLLELMVDYELQNGKVRAAAGVLADLPKRVPELEERLRQAVIKATERREEIAALERLRQDGDLAVSAPARMRLSLVYGAVITVAIITLTTLRRLGIHNPGYPDALGVMSAMAVALILSRSSWEGGNLVNRRIIDAIAASCGLIAVGFLVCWIGDVDFTMGLSISMLIAAATAAGLAVFLERGLGLTALGFLITASLIPVFPQFRGILLAVGNAASFGAAAWVWKRMMSTEGPRPARSMRASGFTAVRSDPRLSYKGGKARRR